MKDKNRPPVDTTDSDQPASVSDEKIAPAFEAPTAAELGEDFNPEAFNAPEGFEPESHVRIEAVAVSLRKPRSLEDVFRIHPTFWRRVRFVKTSNEPGGFDSMRPITEAVSLVLPKQRVKVGIIYPWVTRSGSLSFWLVPADERYLESAWGRSIVSIIERGKREWVGHVSGGGSYKLALPMVPSTVEPRWPSEEDLVKLYHRTLKELGITDPQSDIVRAMQVTIEDVLGPI